MASEKINGGQKRFYKERGLPNISIVQISHLSDYFWTETWLRMSDIQLVNQNNH